MSARQPRRFRPTLTALEDRCLLSGGLSTGGHHHHHHHGHHGSNQVAYRAQGHHGHHGGHHGHKDHAGVKDFDD
jgi:hypothetical protein